MTTTTFTSGTTIASSWLNDVNTVTYTVSGGGEPGTSNSAAELKTKRMFASPSNQPISGPALASSYYFDINNSGTITSADSLGALRLVSAITAPSTDANVKVAYGSSFGTKKVGLGFHTGTTYDILQASTGTTPTNYNNEVNGVILGYLATGAKIVIQDQYIGESTSATPAQHVISYVANQNRFVGGFGIGTATSVTASTYTVLQTDFDIVFATSANCTVTLPIATQENVGRILFLKNTANFSIVSASSNIIPQSSTSATTSIIPAGAGLWVMLKSDGTNWNVIASNIPKTQSYSEVTGSRTAGTTYTNNGAFPIFVTVIGYADAINAGLKLTVDGTVRAAFNSANGGNEIGTVSATVPPGSTYSVSAYFSGGVITNWHELS